MQSTKAAARAEANEISLRVGKLTRGETWCGRGRRGGDAMLRTLGRLIHAGWRVMESVHTAFWLLELLGLSLLPIGLAIWAYVEGQALPVVLAIGVATLGILLVAVLVVLGYREQRPQLDRLPIGDTDIGRAVYWVAHHSAWGR